MKATIYHNPACGTSRAVLAMLNATPGVEVEVIEYLKHPPARDTLATLIARAGLSPHQALRTKERLCDDLDLAHVSEPAVLDAMIENPILIERPLVVTEKGARLCRPADRLREIL